jgi:hypothetical protein
MPNRYGDPDQLENERPARVARRRLEATRIYIDLLDRAQEFHHRLFEQRNPQIQQLIGDAHGRLAGLETEAEGVRYSRPRPRTRPVPDPQPEYYAFLDECGSHNLLDPDQFPAFVLAAVLVERHEYDRIDAVWRGWKAEVFGNPDYIVHEPDLRDYLRQLDRERRVEFEKRLDEVIAGLNFLAIGCVVLREQYRDRYGTGALDESLPAHVYHMSLNFLLERIVLTMDGVCGGARATVIAEARGQLENAQLQAEFARLMIGGTVYVRDGWFRQQLSSWIEFRPKAANSSGLQLVDLLARICGEKAIAPESRPSRWEAFRPKLVREKRTKHGPLGFKVIPWDERQSQNLGES